MMWVEIPFRVPADLCNHGIRFRLCGGHALCNLFRRANLKCGYIIVNTFDSILCGQSMPFPAQHFCQHVTGHTCHCAAGEHCICIYSMCPTNRKPGQEIQHGGRKAPKISWTYKANRLSRLHRIIKRFYSNFSG